MSARFVSLAVGYALAGGELRRKGARQRPWLELQRLETEATYLDHQVRALRQSAGGTARVDLDFTCGEGFYDIARARISSPLLERAMELLCPAGEQRITPDALEVAGARGLACLWLDAGHWDGRAGIIDTRSPADAALLRERLLVCGIEAGVASAGGASVRVAPSDMPALAALLRPQVHRSMRHTLHPGSIHGRSLLGATSRPRWPNPGRGRSGMNRRQSAPPSSAARSSCGLGGFPFPIETAWHR